MSEPGTATLPIIESFDPITENYDTLLNLSYVNLLLFI